ncbi:MAG: hypothetical protein U0K47_01410 [Erysipelotrichaceae bacterium]|nr:hypothetical protein [Erysipelotrichaceae bacterium]
MRVAEAPTLITLSLAADALLVDAAVEALPYPARFVFLEAESNGNKRQHSRQ